MALIYFAAPLFSNAEKAFNRELTETIESLGHEVFLPQRDGVEAEGAAYAALPREERRRALFARDTEMLLACDIFLIVLDGRVPDEGAAVELGMAHRDKALRRPDRLLLGLHTDARAAFFQAKLNPMIRLALDELFEETGGLIAFLGRRESYLRTSST